MASPRNPTPQLPEDLRQRNDLVKWAGVLLALASVLCAFFSIMLTVRTPYLTPTHKLISFALLLVGLVLFAIWLVQVLDFSNLAKRQPPAPLYPDNVGWQRGPAPLYAPNPNAGYGQQGIPAPPPRPMGPPPPRALYDPQQLQEAAQQEDEGSGADLFTSDPLFQLEELRPKDKIRRFILPKEGSAICEDSCAVNGEGHAYAVTDGVARSFIPAPWARILARGIVRYQGGLQGREELATFVRKLSEQWRAWMEQRWAATMNEQRAQRGEGPGDWTHQLHDVGAQATMVSFRLSKGPSRGTVQAEVLAIGDAEFFHFRADGRGGWKLLKAFPLERPEDFNTSPYTLATKDDARLIDLAFNNLQRATVIAQQGDLLVLSSDSIGKWLLTQALPPNAAEAPESSGAAEATPFEEAPTLADAPAFAEPRVDDWQTLLTTTDPAAFAQMVHREVAAGRMEEDDTTLLVIPVR